MTRYINAHRDRFGVEPICRSVQVAPSSYYAARSRPPSARARSDAELGSKVLKVFNDNYRVYGARKLWRQRQREGVAVGRDRVARLMRTLGICGAVRGTTRRTTIADPTAVRAPDLVNRQFTATRPNQLWVSDFTYVASWSGTVYVAFVIDVFSRLIVGWRGRQHAHRAGPGRPGDGRLAAGQPVGGPHLPLGCWQPRRIQLVVATPR